MKKGCLWTNELTETAAQLQLIFCGMHKPEQNTCSHANRKYLKIQLMLIIFPVFATSLNYCKHSLRPISGLLARIVICQMSTGCVHKTETFWKAFSLFRPEVGHNMYILAKRLKTTFKREDLRVFSK